MHEGIVAMLIGFARTTARVGNANRWIGLIVAILIVSAPTARVGNAHRWIGLIVAMLIVSARITARKDARHAIRALALFLVVRGVAMLLRAQIQAMSGDVVAHRGLWGGSGRLWGRGRR